MNTKWLLIASLDSNLLTRFAEVHVVKAANGSEKVLRIYLAAILTAPEEQATVQIRHRDH